MTPGRLPHSSGMAEKTQMPPCAMRLAPCADTAPGVINGAPTVRRSTTATENARNAAATHNRTHKKRRGATCDARMTAAIARNTATADRNTEKNADAAARHAADTLCRHGTGRHKWRPYGLRRTMAARRNGSADRKSCPADRISCPADGFSCRCDGFGGRRGWSRRAGAGGRAAPRPNLCGGRGACRGCPFVRAVPAGAISRCPRCSSRWSCC